MEWVEGPSLEEAVSATLIDDWLTILRCAYGLATILVRAREVPERVLHRDLRPANVMLRGFYTATDWEVVVLDFDLSWHRGASDRSVTYGSTVLGYLTPEQITKTKGVSTRHAGVDVFGLGMLLYYLISRRHPLPSEHRHMDWVKTIQLACKAVPTCGWKSLPARYSRVVLSCTRHEQSERWDMSQVCAELDRIYQACKSPSKVIGMDLIAEEVASRTDCMNGYSWDDDNAGASMFGPTGVKIQLSGKTLSQQLVLQIEWQNLGDHDYQKVGKWLAPAAKNCEAILKSMGWTTRSSIDLQAFSVEAFSEFVYKSNELSRIAESIDKAVQPLRRLD